ncbi:MAG: hypothetical protein E7342_02315 [Clostridiales bacterium]|nr:hypothetical protein [Clostridiales bacterium]
MKKLIIKTAVATVVSVLIVVLALIILLTAFSPKTLADFNYKIGNERLSVYYEELNYKKTNDLSDLEGLIYKINEIDDYDKCIKYSKIMLDDEGFNAFAKDKKGYEFYLVSEYVVALYKTGSTKEECLEKAKKYLEEETEIQLIQTVLDNDK